MSAPSMMQPATEQHNCQYLQRHTRGGRTLWYKLTVLQQPERARACGAGTRANSDRRPVDPPPVVELKISEGGSKFEEGKDITFDYNASFFLYASLEQSRKVIRGRVPGQPNPPILTGVPASGMAYLDRPGQAGYFIFPDLSVRHEGYYNLSFSLFETTKEENDFDTNMGEENFPVGVDWRMEIKTAPFEVYSAKKFPGLKESTALSKQVAEQGCRVRIRREIRMRKRDNKGSARGRRDEEISARRTVTPCEDPNSAAARARSLSNSSEHRPVYPHDPSRRPSAAECYGAPPPGPSPYDHHSQGNLTFGQPGAPQYAPPPQVPAHPQQMPQMSPRHTPYSRPEPQPYAAPPGYVRQDTASQYQSTAQSSPATHYPLNSPASYTSNSHYRRDSQPSYATTPVPSYSSIRPHAPSQAPPPIQSMPSNASRMNISALVDTGAPSHIKDLAPIQAETHPPPPPKYIPTGSKRQLEDSFEQDSRPLHNGTRPNDPHHSSMLPRTYQYSSKGSHSAEYYRAAGNLERAEFPKLDTTGYVV